MAAKINGDYEGLNRPLFAIATSVVAGLFGFVVGCFAVGTVDKNTSGWKVLVLSILTGLIKVVVTAITVYDRTTYGGGDLTKLPPWWYTDQVKLFIFDFFTGFLIALLPLLIAKKFLSTDETDTFD